MNAASDHQLLRAYAVRRDEAAFRELVQRHTDFIYSAALRQVNSDATARDLTQSVFTDLARRAPDILCRHTGDSLAGWLHRATRYAALNHLRDARRRQDNERQAMEQLLTNSDSAADWEQIRPMLDEALDALDDTDREALLLRYFKNQDFRTVGAQLGVSDDAAQKRVSRAVERLREFFAKRGVSVGAGGLIVVISANAVQAAPVGLAVTISAAALAGTAVTTSTIIAATTKTIAMTTLQKTLITAAVAVLASAGIYEARQAAQLRDQVQTLQQQQEPLMAENHRLQTDLNNATNQIAGLYEDIGQLKKNSSELLKLRGEVTRLRNETDSLVKEAEDNLALQAEIMNAISNTPPVRTFVTTASTLARWDQAIVTGGWKMPSGRRVIVLTQFYPEGDAKQLTISSKLISYEEARGKELGLPEYNSENEDSDVRFGAARGSRLLTSEQAKSLLRAAEKSDFIELMSAPGVSTISGRQAQVQSVETHQTPSGEKYFTGPIIDYFPTVSTDGKSLQMGITVHLNYPTYIPTKRQTKP